MTRLSLSSLDHVPADVGQPGYDPATLPIGIVHFGPGAFHRAHQAAYWDTLCARDPRWGIAAVSLRTAGVTGALREQDGLYSLSMLDREPSARVIGVHRAWIGPDDHHRILPLLADAQVRIVSTTVTEKGYCLAADGTLDRKHPDIVHDLSSPDEHPVSVVGWIAAGLSARYVAGVQPFAVLCCDNMTSNGRKLRDAVVAFAAVRDPELADWIKAHGIFPNAMVDSITPATDDAHFARAAETLGLDDKAAVQREGFTQWVLEDVALPGAPDLSAVGVTLTSDVAAFEKAKLRILNGAHSSLAYLGLALGHETVFEAMSDPALAGFVERMVREDVIPTLPSAAGLDLDDYAAAVFDRFRNPAIRHLLSQIAWDGSQKLPYRLLDTTRERQAAGQPLDRLAVPIAAWIAFVARAAESGSAITDPLSERLLAIARDTSPADLVDAMLAVDAGLPAELAGDPRYRDAVARAFDHISGRRFGPLLEI